LRPHLLGVFVLACLAVAARADDGSFFGKQERGSTAGLIGIIYDLKQTQQRKPTGMNPHVFPEVFKEFIDRDWDEAVLNRYFRSARQLYTTQIFIPLMNADTAPKAFGVDGVMKPQTWVAHYKGQVSPPEDGTYRFVGYADDIMAVAVNGKTVMVGGRFNVPPWNLKERDLGEASNGRFAYGDWMELKKDTPIDLDVIIGENPGALFCAFLLYQKQGVEYAQGRDGPILPVFQLAPYEMPKFERRDAPEFQRSPELWKGYQ